MPAMIAGSLRSWSDAGASTPRDRWTTPVVSSTVTNCSPDSWQIASRSGPRHGRISACSPVMRWPRLSLVEICTVSRQRCSASDGVVRVGRGARKLPPSPTKTFTVPVVHRLDGAARCRSRASPAARSRTPSPSACMNSGLIFSQMPTVRSPCTLLCPRTGQTPAPRRPICPRSSAKFTMLCTLATPFLCCVIPIAQQQIIRSDAIAISAASRISSRGHAALLDDPVPAIRCRMSAANASNPSV